MRLNTRTLKKNKGEMEFVLKERKETGLIVFFLFNLWDFPYKTVSDSLICLSQFTLNGANFHGWSEKAFKEHFSTVQIETFQRGGEQS